MPSKDYGYYGLAYLGARIAQVVALIPVVGLVGHFIDQIAKTKHSAPGELTATLIVAVVCTLWALLSLSAYDDTHIPYLATALVDLAILAPLAIVAALLGTPLSQTTCADLPATSTAVLLPLPSRALPYLVFLGAGQTTCYELAAVWGLAIGLCVLFTVSAVAAAFLALGKRRAAAAQQGKLAALSAVGVGDEDDDDDAAAAAAAFVLLPPPARHRRRRHDHHHHHHHHHNHHHSPPPPPSPPSPPIGLARPYPPPPLPEDADHHHRPHD